MKNIFYFRIGFTVFVGTLLFISCEKEKGEDGKFIPQNKKGESILDLHSSSILSFSANGIIAGNSQGMFTRFYNFDLYPTSVNSSKIYKIDVDNNSQNDFKFEVNMSVSPGGTFEFSHLYVENVDVKISGNVITDSIFWHIDTISNTPTLFQYKVTQTCFRMANEDSVKSTAPNSFHPQLYNSGDTIFNGSTFYNSAFEINRSPYTGWPHTSYVNGQQISYTIYDKKDCYSFPIGSIRMIGFKIRNSSGQDKLGWLSLRANSYNSITLISSSVQP